MKLNQIKMAKKKTLKSDWVIIVQGNTHKSIVEQIKKCFADKDIIFSTWKGADESAYEEGDIVLYNDLPSLAGVANLNLQKVSTFKGLEKAQEMGYTKVLKWRSDMIVFDGEEFFAHLDDTKLNAYCWVNDNGGYITDYFFAGNIEDIRKLYEVEVNRIKFPEYVITQRLFGEGLNKKVNFIIDKLKRNQNDIYWYSNDGASEKWFSSHQYEQMIYKSELPEEWPN